MQHGASVKMAFGSLNQFAPVYQQGQTQQRVVPQTKSSPDYVG